MKNYYRVMLGQKSKYANECYAGNFIGAGFFEDIDLLNQLPEDWREFNRKFIPMWLEKNPDKTKVAAGLACGMLWTLSKGINNGDVVLCPNGNGSYYVGEVIGEYSFHPGEILPHRRAISWFPKTIDRTQMSENLKRSTLASDYVCNFTKHYKELEQLIFDQIPLTPVEDEGIIEDPIVFALETHLEDFLVKNWKHTDLGKIYDIYEVEGEIVGRQFKVDTGFIDIFAISKDKKELLVIELKKGRASDVVVGQIQRYMGYILQELAEKVQTVKGIIIALDDDVKIRRALAVAPNIEFYRYQLNFKLNKN